MKAIFEFFQSLGPAEIIVTALLIAVIAYAFFNGRKLNKRLDEGLKWFEKRKGK